MKIVVEADKSNLGKIFDFVNKELSPYNINENIVNKINIVLEEIFVNIANYAYGEKTGEVEITREVNSENVKIIFADSGKRFNPLTHVDPDTSLSVEDREIGGLGILLTKKLMDDVDYEYKDGKNRLKIVKKIKLEA